MITRWLARRGKSTALPGPALQDGTRVYAVGDVHGHIERLVALHADIRDDVLARPVADPVLLHIGDLIDRGPDSAGVVSLLLEGPPVPGMTMVNLMGNHEWMLLEALAGGPDGQGDAEAAAHWVMHGGAAALESWGIAPDAPVQEWAALLPRAHLVFLRDLRRSWRRDRYVFVHAGVKPGVPFSDQLWEDLLWIREPFLDHGGPALPEAPEVVIVHGHTPRPRPVRRRHRIGIDTGAGKGGLLTCAVLEGDSVRFLQA